MICKRVTVTCSHLSETDLYTHVLRIYGVEPVIVSVGSPIPSMLDTEGLILTGGVDIAPSVYGAQSEPETEVAHFERDHLEQRLLGAALRLDIPVLAICRGMQLLNISHPSGTLKQHVEGHRPSIKGSILSHRVILESHTRLFAIVGRKDLTVNSEHHQAVDTIGVGLVVTARSVDGIVEALERPDKRFVVGVQWHPERLLGTYEDKPVPKTYLPNGDTQTLLDFQDSSHRIFQAFTDAL